VIVTNICSIKVGEKDKNGHLRHDKSVKLGENALLLGVVQLHGLAIAIFSRELEFQLLL
jgi:hypothetical protein